MLADVTGNEKNIYVYEIPRCCIGQCCVYEFENVFVWLAIFVRRMIFLLFITAETVAENCLSRISMDLILSS